MDDITSRRAFGIVALVLVQVAFAACSREAAGEPIVTVAPPPATDLPEVSEPAATAATAPVDGDTVDVGAGVRISADEVERLGITAVRDDSVVPAGLGFPASAPTFRITAATQPDAPVTVRLPLAAPLGADLVPVVVIADAASGPWEALPTTLVADGTAVDVAAPHFSFLSFVFAPAADLVAEARRIFDDATAGFVAEAEQPQCAGEADARQSVTITSSASDTLKWCLGVENGDTVLKVTNNRRYPLQARHPGLTTIDSPIDAGSVADWSRIASGDLELLPVRRTVTFRVDDPGAALSVEFNGVAHSLYQLQVGIETASSFLSKFGVTTDLNGALDLALQSAKCLGTVTDISGGDVIANCFGPRDLLEMFGPKAVFVAALMTVAPVIEFFHGSVNAIPDILSGRDRYEISLSAVAPASPAPAPAPPVNELVVGDTGQPVVDLQLELIARGYPIDADGEFGEGTERAVRDVQERMLLDADGRVGPVTSASLGLGAAESGGYTTLDQWSSDLLAWLADGTPGRLPGDAVTALEVWGDSDITGVTWAPQPVQSGVGGRQILAFVLSGEGGVFNGIEICVTSQLTWCGVWSAFFH